MKPKPPPPAATAAASSLLLVEEISKLSLFRNFQRAFSEATGLPLRLVGPGGVPPDRSGAACGNRFCQRILAHDSACAACLQLQEKLTAAGEEQVLTRQCFAGLTESSVAIRIGDRTIGFLLTGEVANRKPTVRQFMQAARQLRDLGLDPDEPALRGAYLATPTLPSNRYRAMLDLLAIFAGHLSLIAGQLLLHGNHAEAENIARAKKFIAEHLTEPLELKTVASQAHLSSCYFCKRFKEATGFTFTAYVARVRVEAAKHLLVNPQARISEVAFEVGFQSLTHFNRVFRQLTGQSPTRYRDGLPGAELKSGSAARI